MCIHNLDNLENFNLCQNCILHSQIVLIETESIQDYAHAHKITANSDTKTILLSMCITVAYEISQNLVQDASSTD